MNNSLALASRDIPLYLDPEETKELQTWEEWITYYLQLSEASNAFSWHKADFLSQLYDKFGGESLEKFAADVGEPRSTVVNYVRVSRAFPPDKRVPHLSFTHHYQASFADSYDEAKKEFVTDSRFQIIEGAADRNISTRELKEEIKEAKEENTAGAILPICEYCKKDTLGAIKYVLFAPNTGKESVRFMLHPECVEEIVKFIKER